MQRRDPVLTLDALDSISSERWATAIAAVFMGFPLHTLQSIAAGGEKMFMGVAEPILRGHQLEPSHYRIIFRAIKRCADLNQRITPTAILEASKDV